MCESRYKSGQRGGFGPCSNEGGNILETRSVVRTAFSTQGFAELSETDVPLDTSVPCDLACRRNVSLYKIRLVLFCTKEVAHSRT